MKARILIADDEPEQVSGFAQILEQKSYEVIIAQDDLEAWYLLEEFRPNLIILDIRFGFEERMGLDILKKIRQVDKTITIVMLTGLRDDGLDSASYKRDADYFISKSVSTQSLLDLVERCLRRDKPDLIVIDDCLEIDRRNASCSKKLDGIWQKVPLEPKELQVLEELALNPGRVILRERLYDLFFPDAQDPANALNKCIAELRKKLEPNPRDDEPILTKRGVGYSFKYYKRG